MSYLMGIDIGTTGTKTVLIDEEGKVIATSFKEHPLYIPRPNWSEQNPEDWWRATVDTIKDVLTRTGIKGKDIAGIGLSGQMHGSVFLGDDHQILRPCILWNDQRTAKQCEYITERIGKERLIELTCNPALTGFTAGKILWVRENEPHIYERIRKILLPKDYVRFCLTGDFATEVSDASGTLLLDVKKRSWSKEVLSELEIDPDFLPPCYESPDVSGTITKKVADITGLLPGTPVVGGGGDQAAGAVGNGIVKYGMLSSTIGTSGVVFAFSDDVKIDPEGRVHTFCHAVPGKWHVMGVMLSAGGSLRWFRDALGEEEKKEASERSVDPYDILMEKAAKVSPGAEGLVFLPYLSGERSPYPDPNARGVFFGLDLRHQKEHLIRAVVEGVTFGMKDCLEIIRGMGIPVRRVRASGGGARSKLWRQIQANIYNLDIETINITEGAAFGAALLAGVGAGIYASVEEACERTIKVSTTIKPDPADVAVYKEFYNIYHSLYPALFSHFAKLAKVQGSTFKVLLAKRRLTR